MPENIIGLDIGTTSVRAVQVTTGLKGYQVTASAVVNMSETVCLEDALETLFGGNEFKSGTLITSLPSNCFSFRRLSFPFRDRKKIAQAITFELEPLLPQPIGEMVTDFIPMGPRESSKILTASVHRKIIDERMEIIGTYGSKCTAIDVDAVSQAARLVDDGLIEGRGLVIDIGLESSTGVFIDGGGICHVRSFSFCGEKITERTAETLGISFDEAEARKREGHQEDARDDVAGLLRDFFRNIEMTIEFLVMRENIEAPSRIFLTGGGSLYSPIKEEMSARFSVPVETVNMASTGNIQMDERTRKNWNPVIMNQALALATRGTKKNCFNFGPGESGLHNLFKRFRSDIKWAAALFFAILCLGAVDAYLDYHYDRTYLKKLKTEINSTFMKACPEVTRIVDPLHQLRVKIAETRRSTLEGEGMGSNLTVLEILKDISSLIPSSVDFLISHLIYDGATVTITGSTDNFNSADMIKGFLAKSKLAKDITISSATMKKKENRVNLNLKVELM